MIVQQSKADKKIFNGKFKAFNQYNQQYAHYSKQT